MLGRMNWLNCQCDHDRRKKLQCVLLQKAADRAAIDQRLAVSADTDRLVALTQPR